MWISRGIGKLNLAPHKNQDFSRFSILKREYFVLSNSTIGITFERHCFFMHMGATF